MPYWAAAGYAPAFVVKLSSVQVRPESQSMTGKGPGPSGVKTLNVIGVPVLVLAWRQ